MYRLTIHTTAVLLLAVTPAAAADPSPNAYAGFARVEITPPVGWRMAGNYFESFSVAVDDPLFARVMHLSSGDSDSSGLVISLDLCSIGRSASAPIRLAITDATGIPQDRIIISATHNHAGPEYYGTLRDELHRRAKKANGGEDPAEPIDYFKLLSERISSAALEAIEKSKLATLRVGEKQIHGLAFNRRFHMRDGSVQMNPGLRNPNIVRVAGPVDPRLPVLFARSTTTPSSPMGLYTTFAIHTATYGDLTRIGADFPGVLDERMRAKHGEDFVAMFGEGTAGDTNHIDVTAEQPADKWNVYRQIGNRLADAIDQLEPELKPIDRPMIRWGRKIVPIPLAEVDQELLPKANEVLFAPPGEKTFLERVDAWKALNTQRLRTRDGDHLQAELQAVAIGDDYAIVSLPHEVFVELGMQIRSESPFATTAVITLAQDLDFYVPTRRAFVEGSYEVTTTGITAGGGETMAQAATELLQSLQGS